MLAFSQEINLLAPADLKIIEDEHAELNIFLQDLLAACSCGKLNKLNNSDFCDQEKVSSCQGRLTSFLTYGIYIVSKHFEHEESIILDTLHMTKQHELFRLHQNAHEEILQKFNDYVRAWTSIARGNNTHIIYSQFYKVLNNLLNEHDHKFDAPFIRFTNN
jgi:hypothetical protein